MRSKRNRGKGLQLKKYNLGGVVNATDPIKKPAKRVGSRINPDGTESTHLYATETLDGKNWVSFPMLFQNADGSWVDMSSGPWEDAYEEAKKRGEVIDFGQNKQEALDWGMGSWKVNPYKTDQPTAIMDNTYIPTAAEQQLMNLAPLLPKGDPDPYRDQGTIRPQQPNEPTYLQKLWEGTPLGQTEEEKYASPDQMSMVDVMAEPLKALAYYSFDSNRGKLPTRAEWDAFDDSNAIDMATSIVNPFWYMSEMSKGGSEGLAGITGIGKIGNVVRDAFNTGDDILRISAENISKQGQKMTQRQLTQQINRSPLVDLEEAIYNPEIYGAETPGFGPLSRNKNNHYLGQPGGPLVTQLQNQHAADYGISAQGFGLRHMDYFNVTSDGNELPITRFIDNDGVRYMDDLRYDAYVPGSFVSGSVPQIKPLQAGGELEKFIKKDGMINLDEVAKFVGTSKSISPADRFILNEAIAKMGSMGVDVLGYNEFKRAVSNYIPRMTLRSETYMSDYGVSRIFPDVSNLEGMGGPKFTAEAVAIGEGDLPTSVYSDSGGEMTNYMLDNMGERGMHYKYVRNEDYERIGSHSHYRVVRREDEPETSYFLELQSDALKPGGGSEYNKMIHSGKIANASVRASSEPVSVGQFYLDDMTGQMTVRGFQPIGLVSKFSTDYQAISNFGYRLSEIVRENRNLFPPFTEAELNLLNSETEERIKKAINALDEKKFKKVFKNSVEPRAIKTHSSYLSPRDGFAISALEDGVDDILDRMSKMNEKLSPMSEFRNNLANSMDYNNASYDEGVAIYDEAMKGVISDNRYTSRLTNIAFERVDDAYEYVDYKFTDISDFREQVQGFIKDYNTQIRFNKFLDDVPISREDMEPLEGIIDEVSKIRNQLEAQYQQLIMLKSDLYEVRRALDIDDDAVFPIENPSYKVTNSFTKAFERIQSSVDAVKRISTGTNGVTIQKGFDETIKNYPDIYSLADKYNDLMVEFNKEVKKFRDKYVPITEGPLINPVSQIMKKRPERRIIGEALHGPHNNLYNRFPTEETSRKIQGHPAIGKEEAEKYDDVHKKYKNMEKTLKAMGYEPKLVTDKNGNTWWEVKASAGMIHGTAEYDAYWKGGRIGLKKKRSRKMRSVKC